MSKYYKAEDVINAIEDKIAEYIPTLYGRYGEIPLELRMAIEHLPTIEVSDSEKPNNCETCKHNHKEWWELPCDYCCGAHSGYEPKTEPQTERSE